MNIQGIEIYYVRLYHINFVENQLKSIQPNTFKLITQSV